MYRVAGVGLHPITAGTLQLRRCRDHAADPVRAAQRPGQTEPGRARLIGHRDRPRKITQPAADVIMSRGQPRREQLTGETIDARRSHRPCVHVEPHARTL